MQNQNYHSIPTNQVFQPIQAQQVDFKLFVLLILVVFLGVLINQYSQQLDQQKQNCISSSQTSQANPQNSQIQNPELNMKTVSRIEENQQSLSSQKQLYLLSSTLQIINSQHKHKKLVSQSEKSQGLQQDEGSTVSEQPQKENLVVSKSQQKFQQKNSQEDKNITQINQDNGLKIHKKILKQYSQFYFWFPVFIFALIMYTCYEKQYSQNSIFISVKRMNFQQQLGVSQQCAICITQINNSDLLAVLPCSNKHIFHSQCIKKWLLLKKTCPICRSDVRNSRKQQIK